MFPPDYPLSPPKMKFICEMFHPNGKHIFLILRSILGRALKSPCIVEPPFRRHPWVQDTGKCPLNRCVHSVEVTDTKVIHWSISSVRAQVCVRYKGYTLEHFFGQGPSLCPLNRGALRERCHLSYFLSKNK